MLQKGNKVQVPRLYRWQYKMEADEVMKVTVAPAESVGDSEEFLAKMNRDGRLTIPRLILKLLGNSLEESVMGLVLEVTVGPADKG
jgi:hypothetical protein